MKISKLIKKLKRIKEKYGDLEVFIEVEVRGVRAPKICIQGAHYDKLKEYPPFDDDPIEYEAIRLI